MKYFKGIYKELIKDDKNNTKNIKSNKSDNNEELNVEDQKKNEIELMVRQLISSELFIKYLKRSYIIKSIMNMIIFLPLILENVKIY